MVSNVLHVILFSPHQNGMVRKNNRHKRAVWKKGRKLEGGETLYLKSRKDVKGTLMALVQWGPLGMMSTWEQLR